MGMVEEFASPIKYVIPEASDDSDNPADVAAEPTLEKDYTKGTFGIVDPRLSTVEQELDAERRALRAKFLDPLPIPTQPIHQQYIYLADNRQHHKVSICLLPASCCACARPAARACFPDD